MRPLVVVAGPTAVGKSALAVKLAKRINGEIISADSMQVYRGMDIGSAKITKEEMESVKHHLIDILEPSEEFSVATFSEYAGKACEEIYKSGKIPIVCGGTGFYVQALLYGIDFSESNGENPKYREELQKRIETEGIDSVYAELQSIDINATKTIHKNNIKRVIRALEFFHETGKKISEHNEEQRKREPIFNYCYFALNDDRSLVYERIDNRVDKMIENGLLEEVKALKEKGYSISDVSMQGLGYKEILLHLADEISLEEAVYRIKRDSRHFAKRQITWFNREKDIIWLNKLDFDYDDERILDYMVTCLKQKGVLNEAAL